MHTRENFDIALQELTDSILLMASKVEEQMSIAVSAYERFDPSLADTIDDLDRDVNRMRFEIEDSCITLIATQQPAARDLRLIVATMNVIVDLERMGDQAKGVGKALRHLQGRPASTLPPEIAQMGKNVLKMLRQAKNAYATRDIELARKVADSDDEVDRLYAHAFTQIVFAMAGLSTPDEVEREYEVIRIGREFERFGDLVTNIAERLIFLVTGTYDRNQCWLRIPMTEDFRVCVNLQPISSP